MYRRISISIAAVCLIMISNSLFAGGTANIEQAEALVKNYITSGKDAEALAAYQKLITDFSANPLLSTSVYNIAEAYRNSSKFDKSLLVYQDVVTKWPSDAQALWAQRGVAVSFIALGKLTEARDELNKLKTDYSTDPNVAEAVFGVADAYYWFGKYSEADGVYKDVAASYPKSDFAMWAQMGLAISAIAQNKDSVAAAAKDNLLAAFPSHPKLPEALFYIAARYDFSKKYDKAIPLYQHIAAAFPQSPQAADARFAIAKIGIISLFDTSRVNEGMTAVDKLMTDFKSHPTLASTLSRDIAEQFYIKAFESEKIGLAAQTVDYLTRATTIWEKVINEFGEKADMSEECCWTAESYKKLNKYDKAVVFYQKLLNKYPQHKMAWNAQFMTGYCYEALTASGKLTETETEGKTKEAYGKLLEKYPNCPAAEHAKAWLSEHNER